MKNLKYDMLATHKEETRHPQIVMRDIGITYGEAMPQTMGDCWWFIDCKNVPETLPIPLSILRDEITALL